MVLNMYVSCNIAHGLIIKPNMFDGCLKHIHYDNKRDIIFKRNSGLHVTIIGSHYVDFIVVPIGFLRL